MLDDIIGVYGGLILILCYGMILVPMACLGYGLALLGKFFVYAGEYVVGRSMALERWLVRHLLD